MADQSIYAGPALRRLRKRERLTQSAMAQRLGISGSYLNLIERNQRPLTARVILALVEQFEFDARSLREDEKIGGIDGLVRRLADERFADIEIDREEIAEFLGVAPHAAAAFARLFDSAGADTAPRTDPMAECRREIERWRNHFPDLDSAAETLADELRLSRGDTYSGLTERLRDRHRIAVRILPRDVMPEAIRRLDLHARQLQLSEMLDAASRTFQVALQLAWLEQRDAIAEMASGPVFAEEAARQLFENHLAAYFAAALVMPYRRFLRACEATNYDLAVLQRRFGVGFEHLAHRLTTLQRVGERGLPFFMLRLDRAGQVSKRFAGASGANWLDSDASCPLWIAHAAFERIGRTCVQAVVVEGVNAGPDHWLTIARAVEGSGAPREARFAVVLGIEARLAGDLADARETSLHREAAQPIGMGCTLCRRPDCRQRSLPPRGVKLEFDRHVRGVTPFRFDAT